MARKERCENCRSEKDVRRARDRDGVERTLCAVCWEGPLFTLGPAAMRGAEPKRR